MVARFTCATTVHTDFDLNVHLLDGGMESPITLNDSTVTHARCLRAETVSAPMKDTENLSLIQQNQEELSDYKKLLSMMNCSLNILGLLFDCSRD